MEKAQRSKKAAAVGATSPRAASFPLAQKGIRSGHDFASFMSALMSDVVQGRVSPQVTNAACNAGSKLLRIVEVQYRLGGKPKGPSPFALNP